MDLTDPLAEAFTTDIVPRPIQYHHLPGTPPFHIGLLANSSATAFPTDTIITITVTLTYSTHL
jgi:hypothetical protein